MMEKDSAHTKAEGKWDETKGKVKEEAGKLGGDRSTEIGGKLDQAKGKGKPGRRAPRSGRTSRAMVAIRSARASGRVPTWRA